ncbi:XdhC family protein [Halosimplex amylolyticum]|uniref:XdhC family protein n=1 Tax=Halosimplex amylolyticum TaxID=3396616 RepID=UPI003F5461B1
MTRNETDDGGSDEPVRRDATDGDVSELERELTDRGEAYARVTVVRREPPVSANVGDRAVVTTDGELHGWIGGAACAQTTAVDQATAAIEAGEPRLIGIAPDPDTVDRSGLEAFPMRCHSEGVLELFVEPVDPTPELVVVGNSPIARSLTRLATELAVDVTVVDPEGADDLPADETVTATDPATVADAVGPSPLVVVASMGQYDARGVAAGLDADAEYVGLVASDARSDEVTERAAALLDTDPETVRAAVTNPAGVDIAAHTPAEIAVSILAEVVDARTAAGTGGRRAPAAESETTADDEDEDVHADRDHEGQDNHDHENHGSHDHEDHDHGTGDPDAVDDLATDPVCGMAVDPETAAATVEHDGRTYHFCCEGCADSFESDPASYLNDGETAPP